MAKKVRAKSHPMRMADFERQFNTGEKCAVLYALGECVGSSPEKQIPQWVRDGFLKAMYDVSIAKVRSWDDVFGRPLPKGKHLNARRRHLRLREQVWRRCMERRADGAAIGGKLFGDVAGDLRIAMSEVRDIFYEVKRTRRVVERGRRIKGAPLLLPRKSEKSG